MCTSSYGCLIIIQSYCFFWQFYLASLSFYCVNLKFLVNILIIISVHLCVISHNHYGIFVYLYSLCKMHLNQFLFFKGKYINNDIGLCLVLSLYQVIMPHKFRLDVHRKNAERRKAVEKKQRRKGSYLCLLSQTANLFSQTHSQTVNKNLFSQRTKSYTANQDLFMQASLMSATIDTPNLPFTISQSPCIQTLPRWKNISDISQDGCLTIAKFLQLPNGEVSVPITFIELELKGYHLSLYL